MNNKKKIVIIGAGVSGLTAGIYGLKNGFDVEIIEKNPRPGGLCISWKRKGYLIDGCIHWLTGTRKNSDLYQVWKDTGVIKDDSDIINHTDAGVIYYNNERITLYCDAKKLQDELIRVAPEDTKQIKKFIKQLIKIYNVPLPMHEPINTMNIFLLLKVGIRLLPYLPFYIRISKSTCKKYSKKFKSPILRYLINRYQTGPGSLYAMMYSFATIIFNNGGVPKRGSQGLTDRMVDTFTSLGGKLSLNKPAREFIIQKKKVEAVRLEDDSLVKGDYFISALDGKFLLDTLLNKQYKNKAFDSRFSNYRKYPSPSCYMAYYAVDKDKVNYLGDSHQLFFPIPTHYLANTKIKSMKVRSFAYDDTFTRNGKTVVEVLLDQYNWDYDYWVNLFTEPEEYFARKEEIASEIVDEIVTNNTNFKKEDFTLIDTFTPLTLNRYTNAYMGSYMSFMMTNNTSILFHKGRIGNIKNLYVASQWGQSPGGLPLAAIMGKFSIQRILKKERKKHRITKRLYHKVSQ